MPTAKPTETSKVSQHCLDTLTVESFIKSLPKNIEVYSMRFRGNFRGARKQLSIPEYLKNMGVVRAGATAEEVDVRGKFDNSNSTVKQTILQSIDRIAKTYHIATNRMFVEFVTVIDKAQTSTLSFKRMYKQIRFPNDRRMKKLVLGMTEGKGSDYHGMLADMSAKNIVCTLAKTEKTIVLCSEEVAKK